MATALDNTGLNETTPTPTPKRSTMDEVPDYNEAFPQLRSAGPIGGNRSNPLFSSTYSSLNGNSSAGAMANTTTTTSLYSANKAEQDRRQNLAKHASAVTTKIIEIPPDERVFDKGENRRGPNQSFRTGGANNSGQSLQKICARIQKETTTNITFLYKDQTLLVTITGRPEQVRLAQVQLLREIQRPVRITVDIPLDFHRYIIGARGATLKLLEQETLTSIKVPQQDSQSNEIVIEGAKDNVKLCEQRILQLYHNQSNKGFERLNIPYLYHRWIRQHLLDDLQRELNVTINLPPAMKQADEISVRGEREPVEQAKARIMQYFKSLENKIMTFPLDIPCEQHRFILGKKGAGVKEIFDKTNVYVRIPNQEENSTTIQVIGETGQIGEAITMIYKMANAVTAVQIPATRWMHSAVKGDHNSRLEGFRSAHPDVRVICRDDVISVEGPPEEVEHVRKEIQTVLDDLQKRNIICLEVDVDPQYYRQLIGKSQARLNDLQQKTECEVKFPPFDEGRSVQIIGKRENAEKARALLLEQVQKLSNELTADLSIDPQYYPQLIGSKGKNLEEVRSKFHNIQITFPEAKGKSDKVVLHGDKEDVEKCSQFLQQKFKDLHTAELTVPKRLYPMLIGKGGANIQRLREKVPEVRIDVPSLDDTKESTPLRLNGKKSDVEKAQKILQEHVNQLNNSMENSVEQTISIDPKWHSRFFQNKRKLLTDLQQQYGDMLIKIPDRTANSDQVLLRGSKEVLEQVRKRLEELVETWENTVTKETTIPHRHHGYLLARSGAHIQPIQREFNVQIKFPSRPSNNATEEQETSTIDETQKDIVRITGRSSDVDRAIETLEKIVPVETTVEIPFECHGSLVGKGGSNLVALTKQYPDVQVTLPPMNSSQNTIQLRGQREQVEGVRKELLDSYEKYQADRQARSFEVRFTIKPEQRSILFGNRGRTINNLRKTYEVKIETTANQTPSTAIVPTPVSTNNNDDEQQQQQHDDQQAIPEENLPLPSETNASNALTDIEVVITGYEDKALTCRDEILRLIKDFEAKITMEIEIDPRVHARIIGSGGQKLQQIMRDYNVEIKFQANNQSDKVHVIGLDQEKIDNCIDHLLALEEDFLPNPTYRSVANAQNPMEYSSASQVSNVQQQEVPSNNQGRNNRNENSFQKNKQQRQAPFQVKNAPWTNGNENENEHYQSQHRSATRQRTDHENSPKKSTPMAPNRDDLGEYPSFSNGVDDAASQVQQTTVNPIPVVWGPQKRK